MVKNLQPTYDKENLHSNIADSGAAGQIIIITDEAHIVGHCHSYVEGSKQNQPVPACFKCAVVKQYEFGLLGICNLVFR